MSHIPLFELTRGGIVESRHFGAVAVADASGRLVASAGDPGLVTFLRSTAKPLQAIPLVESGAVQEFHLTPKEVAIACASHLGMDEHVETVAGFMAKAGLSEADLLCGTHPVGHRETAKRMRDAGIEPTPIRHNCSGKHTGMLAQARLRGLPLADYVSPKHGVQESILRAFAEMCGMGPEQVVVGIDGCSAPNFAVPLHHCAAAFARLMDPTGLPAKRAQACRQIVEALTSHPNMIRGPGGFDTTLMTVGKGRFISKAGAEGYQGIGIAPGAIRPGSPALGVAIKISDGDQTGRAGDSVAVEVLRQLGALDDADLAGLAHHRPGPVKNWRGIVAGEQRTAFELDRH